VISRAAKGTWKETHRHHKSSFAVEKDHTHTCNTLTHSNANALTLPITVSPSLSQSHKRHTHTHSQATCTHSGMHSGMDTSTHTRAQTITHHLVGRGGRACRLLVLALVSRAWSQVPLVLGQHTQTNAGDEDVGRRHNGWGAWAFRSTAPLHQRLQLKHVVAAGRPCWRVSVAAHAGCAAPTTGAWIDPHAGYAAQVRPPPASERGTKQVRHAAPRDRIDSLLRRRGGGTCATQPQAFLDQRCGALLKCACALTESGRRSRPPTCLSFTVMPNLVDNVCTVRSIH
jgi:hypothetical protein